MASISEVQQRAEASFAQAAEQDAEEGGDQAAKIKAGNMRGRIQSQPNISEN